MSRRCKPGSRARIIDGGANHGKIVLVVRPYFYPEEVDGAAWPDEIVHPWVLTSLSGPLRAIYTETKEECPPSMTLVCEDDDLEPLDDEDDGSDRSTDADRPVRAQKSEQDRAEHNSPEQADQQSAGANALA